MIRFERARAHPPPEVPREVLHARRLVAHRRLAVHAATAGGDFASGGARLDRPSGDRLLRGLDIKKLVFRVCAAEHGSSFMVRVERTGEL